MKQSPSIRQKAETRSFSLVEMLVVMAIIAILLALGAGGYQVARRALSKSRTEALLAKVKLALESYKSRHGYYPVKYPTQDTDPVPFSLDDDALQPNFNKFVDSSKIKNDESIKIGNIYYLRDGWNSNNDLTGMNAPAKGIVQSFINSGKPGGVILYLCPGKKNPMSFDLYSAGNDRRFDNNDDIYAK
ncbi:type II secretion system protein [Lentisphaerota bacterium ZTH]|nr:type II secretion system protein [Lentisphaerota bacterium]WET05421.1 type II secretion system protein [Lentisphaerota bacterium ZTH]